MYRSVLTQCQVPVVVIVVVRTAGIIRSGEGNGPLTSQVKIQNGIDNQQGCIAIVTLHVQVVQVGSTVDLALQVSFLIALPGVETEVLGIERQASNTSEVKLRLRLDAESAAHIIVTLDDVEKAAPHGHILLPPTTLRLTGNTSPYPER